MLKIDKEALEMALFRVSGEAGELDRLWSEAAKSKEFLQSVEKSTEWLIKKSQAGQDDLRSLVGAVVLRYMIIGMIMNEDKKDLLELEKMYQLPVLDNKKP